MPILKMKFIGVLDFINSDHYSLVESDEAITIHVLGSRPLGANFGKNLVAKQIMAWEGSNNYYTINQESRYLVYEWILHGSGAFNYKDPNSISRQLLVLIGIAVRTNRILIMPKLAWFEKFLYAWELIDMSVLDDIIEWR